MPINTSPSVSSAVVGPSGQTLLVFFQDAEGNPTNVTSIVSSSGIQTIQLPATPSGSAFAVSFDGHTTASIPVTVSPPNKYFLWTGISTIVGHNYNFAVNFYTVDHDVTGVTYLYETIVSGVVIGTATRSGPEPAIGTSPGEIFADGLQASGLTAYWFPVYGITDATTTTVQIRCTAAGYYPLRMSALRVQDTTANTVTYYTASETANVSAVPSGSFAYQAAVNSYGGNEYFGEGFNTGIGPVITVTGGAAALQAALQALPSVGYGGMVVTDESGQGTGNYTISLASSLAYQSYPAITCTDGAVALAVVSAGGNGPSLAIDGGSAQLAGASLWTVGLPYHFIPLFQSGPAVTTSVFGMLPCVVSGGNFDGQTPVAGSLSGAPSYAWDANVIATFDYSQFAPGTYQLAITFPTTPWVDTIFETIDGTGEEVTVTVSPFTATKFHVYDLGGNLITTFTVNQTVAPSDYSSKGVEWKILGSFSTTLIGFSVVMTTEGLPALTLGATTQVAAVLDAIQITRTSADNSIVVGSGVPSTLSIPANTVVTAAGALPAVTNFPVTPPTASAILPPFVPGQNYCPVGYNIEPANYYSTVLTHLNLAYLIGTGLAPDANGWSTRILTPGYSQGSYTTPIIINSPQLAYADPLVGSTVIPDGLYWLRWDGSTEDLILIAGEFTTVTEQDQYRHLTGTTGNLRVYLVTHDATRAATASISLQMSSTVPDLVMDPTGYTFVIDATEIELYQPDYRDPTGMTLWGYDAGTGVFTTPAQINPLWYWQPGFLYILQDHQCIRNMDLNGTNVNSAYSYSHFKVATHANRCSPCNATDSFAISSMGPIPENYTPTGGGYYVPIAGSPLMQVEMSAPMTDSSTLYPGCQVNFKDCGTAVFGTVNAVLDDPSAATGTVTDVIDSTHVIIQPNIGTVDDQCSATTSVSGGSLLTENTGTIWPIQDYVKLFDAVPSLKKFHFNLPGTMDVSSGGAVYQVAHELGSGVKAGVQFCFEFGNEWWNNHTAISQFGSRQQAAITGSYDGYEIFYARQGALAHAQCLAALADVGRPQDMIHLWGTQAGYTGPLAATLAECQRIGARVDQVCTAIYYQCTPAPGYGYDVLPIYRSMTAKQWVDFGAVNSVWGGYPELLVGNIYPVLAQYGYGSAKVIAYEGSDGFVVGPDLDVNGNPSPATTADFYTRTVEVLCDPQMMAINLQWTQSFANVGLVQFCWFHDGGTGSANAWPMFTYNGQLRGTGNPAIDTVNVSNPIFGKNQTVNERAAGLHAWALLANPPAPVNARTLRQLRAGGLR